MVVLTHIEATQGGKFFEIVFASWFAVILSNLQRFWRRFPVAPWIRAHSTYERAPRGTVQLVWGVFFANESSNDWIIDEFAVLRQKSDRIYVAVPLNYSKGLNKSKFERFRAAEMPKCIEWKLLGSKHWKTSYLRPLRALNGKSLSILCLLGHWNATNFCPRPFPGALNVNIVNFEALGNKTATNRVFGRFSGLWTLKGHKTLIDEAPDVGS